MDTTLVITVLATDRPSIVKTLSETLANCDGTWLDSLMMNFIALELGVSVKDVHGLVLGGHGDTMVPLPRHTSVGGIPITELITTNRLNEIIKRTANGGGEMVNLLDYSAYSAPAAGTAQMVESILRDQKRMIPCAVQTQGEYGYDGLFIGLPVILGRGGAEK